MKKETMPDARYEYEWSDDELAALTDDEFESDDEFEHECYQRDLAAREQITRETAGTVYWIRPEPVWAGNGIHWLDQAMLVLLTRRVEGASVILRLNLPGGDSRDSLKVRVKARYGVLLNELPDDPMVLAHEAELTAYVADDNGMRVSYKSRLADTVNEMSSAAIVSRTMPVAVAERIANLFRQIEDNVCWTDVMVYLPDAKLRALIFLRQFITNKSRCMICSRPLKDAVSKEIGIGPVCARLVGVRHYIPAARKLRCGTPVR